MSREDVPSACHLLAGRRLWALIRVRWFGQLWESCRLADKP